MYSNFKQMFIFRWIFIVPPQEREISHVCSMLKWEKIVYGWVNKGIMIAKELHIVITALSFLSVLCFFLYLMMQIAKLAFKKNPWIYFKWRNPYLKASLIYWLYIIARQTNFDVECDMAKGSKTISRWVPEVPNDG